MRTGEFLGDEEIGDDRNHDDHRNPHAVADEGNAGEEDAEQHADADFRDAVLLVKLADGPDEAGYRKDCIDEHAHVVAAAEHIDEEEFEILRYLDESGDKAVEDKSDYHSRNRESHQ